MVALLCDASAASAALLGFLVGSVCVCFELSLLQQGCKAVRPRTCAFSSRHQRRTSVTHAALHLPAFGKGVRGVPQQVDAAEGRGELAAYALSGTAGTPTLQPVRRATEAQTLNLLGFRLESVGVCAAERHLLASPLPGGQAVHCRVQRRPAQALSR